MLDFSNTTRISCLGKPEVTLHKKKIIKPPVFPKQKSVSSSISLLRNEVVESLERK